MKIQMQFQENASTFGLGYGEKVEIHENNDYERLANKPSIEGVPLVGDKTFPQLNLRSLNNTELEELLTI